MIPFLIIQVAPIVVTGKPLGDVVEPLSVEQLDGEDLRRHPAFRIENVLTAIPDIQTFRRADSASAHPTSGGLTARGLGGNAAGRMLVVMDGVPQNDPFGGWVAWPGLATGSIGRIRIDRGGGQARWGNGAIAGTVEMDSAGPEEGPFEVDLETGSRRSFHAAARAIVGNDNAYVLASGEFRRSDGFIPIVAEERGAADRPAPFRQWNGMVRAAVELAPELELQGGVQHFDDRRSRGLEYSGNRGQGTDLSVRLVGRGSHPFQWSIYRQRRLFSSGFAATDPDRAVSRPVLDQDPVPASGWGTRGEWDAVATKAGRVRVGGDIRQGRGETHENYLFVGNVPTRDRFAGGAFSTAGAFVEGSADFGGWEASAAARLDRWWLDDGHILERQIGGVTLNSISFANRSGWVPSGRASLRRTSRNLKWEVAVYRGWRLPTLNELYRPYRVGADAFAANADLVPETLTGGEISARLEISRHWTANATVFADRLSNAIANATVGTGPGVFPGVGFVAAGARYSQRVNLDAINSRGVEAGIAWQDGAWYGRAAASLVHARVNSGGAGAQLDGHRPAQVPAAGLTVDAGWRGGPYRRVDLTLNYRSKAFDDDLGQTSLRPSFAGDVTVEWPLADRLSVHASAENIWNDQIETGIGTDGAVERSRPRTLWLGFSLHPGR